MSRLSSVWSRVLFINIQKHRGIRRESDRANVVPGFLTEEFDVEKHKRPKGPNLEA